MTPTLALTQDIVADFTAIQNLLKIADFFTKSALRTAIKKAYFAVDTNADNKTEAVRLAIKKIDQATAKGILHKNTAARSKSSLAKRLNASA